MIASGEIWVASIVSPLMVLIVGGFIAWLSKRADWARQDEVAARVEAAATQLVASDRERHVAFTGVKTELQVIKTGQDEIHEIVNSSRTKMIERIDQLIEALTAAGITIPIDPNPTE